MFLDINRIEPGGVDLDGPLDIRSVESPSGESLVVREAVIRAHAQRDAKGVNFTGRLRAAVEVPCSRCLEPSPLAIDETFFLILVPDAVELPAGHGDVSEDDVALFYTKSGVADIREIALEQLYLNLPQKTVCKPGCLGLCQICGENRNGGRCDCAADDIDPRLAPLLALKRQTTDQ